MTSYPPQGPGAPDQDPTPPPNPYLAPGGPTRQPPLVPYQPPAAGIEDAPVEPDPYFPPAGPAGAGFPTTPPPVGSPAHPPYGAPGTPVHGSPYGSPYPPAPGHAPGPYPQGQWPPGANAPYPGAPQGQPPAWQQGPAWMASFAPPPRQNGLALASMITSLAGLALCFFPGVVGLVLGIVALQQISRDGTTGRGYAITGITVGAVMTALLALWFIGVAASSA